MEHRWGKRSSVDVPVTLHLGSGAAVRGRIANLSLSGALVLADIRIRVFSQVIVELEDSLWSDSGTPHVAAYVAREAREGLGLEWTDFSPSPIAELLSRATATLLADVASRTHHYDRLRSPVVGGQFERPHWR
jgi:hypothetical protein